MVSAMWCLIILLACTYTAHSEVYRVSSSSIARMRPPPYLKLPSNYRTHLEKNFYINSDWMEKKESSESDENQSPISSSVESIESYIKPSSKYPNAPKFADMFSEITYNPNINFPSHHRPHVYTKPEIKSSWLVQHHSTNSRKVPSLQQALSYFDRIKEVIKYRILGPEDGSEEQTRYLMIIGAIDGMIRAMVNRPWNYHNEEFNARLPGMLEYVQEAPNNVKKELICIYDQINKKLSRLRNIMNNTAFKSICRVSRGNCDKLLYAIAMFCGDEMKNELKLLDSLGKISSLFLHEYEKEFARKASGQSDIAMYIRNNKEHFMKLVRGGVEVRKYLPDSGMQCYK